MTPAPVPVRLPAPPFDAAPPFVEVPVPPPLFELPPLPKVLDSLVLQATRDATEPAKSKAMDRRNGDRAVIEGLTRED